MSSLDIALISVRALAFKSGAKRGARTDSRPGPRTKVNSMSKEKKNKVARHFKKDARTEQYENWSCWCPHILSFSSIFKLSKAFICHRERNKLLINQSISQEFLNCVKIKFECLLFEYLKHLLKLKPLCKIQKDVKRREIRDLCVKLILSLFSKTKKIVYNCKGIAGYFIWIRDFFKRYFNAISFHFFFVGVIHI